MVENPYFYEYSSVIPDCRRVTYGQAFLVPSGGEYLRGAGLGHDKQKTHEKGTHPLALSNSRYHAVTQQAVQTATVPHL